MTILLLPRWRLAAFVLALLLGGPWLGGCVTVESPPQVTDTPLLTPDSFEGAAWLDLPVHYCVVDDDAGFASYSDLVNDVDVAFQRWGIKGVNDGACASAMDGGDGINQIGWGAPPSGSQGSVHAAGYTAVRFQACTGNCPAGSRTRMVEADIYLNPDAPRFLRSSTCLLTTVMHELGHFLGVQHLEPPALMAAVSTTCDPQLTAADRAALSALYPGQ